MSSSMQRLIVVETLCTYSELKLQARDPNMLAFGTCTLSCQAGQADRTCNRPQIKTAPPTAHAQDNHAPIQVHG